MSDEPIHHKGHEGTLKENRDHADRGIAKIAELAKDCEKLGNQSLWNIEEMSNRRKIPAGSIRMIKSYPSRIAGSASLSAIFWQFWHFWQLPDPAAPRNWPFVFLLVFLWSKPWLKLLISNLHLVDENTVSRGRAIAIELNGVGELVIHGAGEKRIMRDVHRGANAVHG
jgi:hypothetical protein